MLEKQTTPETAPQTPYQQILQALDRTTAICQKIDLEYPNPDLYAQFRLYYQKLSQIQHTLNTLAHQFPIPHIIAQLYTQYVKSNKLDLPQHIHISDMFIILVDTFGCTLTKDHLPTEKIKQFISQLDNSDISTLTDCFPHNIEDQFNNIGRIILEIEKTPHLKNPHTPISHNQLLTSKILNCQNTLIHFHFISDIIQTPSNPQDYLFLKLSSQLLEDYNPQAFDLCQKILQEPSTCHHYLLWTCTHAPTSLLETIYHTDYSKNFIKLILLEGLRQANTSASSRTELAKLILSNYPDTSKHTQPILETIQKAKIHKHFYKFTQIICTLTHPRLATCIEKYIHTDNQSNHAAKRLAKFCEQINLHLHLAIIDHKNPLYIDILSANSKEEIFEITNSYIDQYILNIEQYTQKYPNLTKPQIQKLKTIVTKTEYLKPHFTAKNINQLLEEIIYAHVHEAETDFKTIPNNTSINFSETQRQRWLTNIEISHASEHTIETTDLNEVIQIGLKPQITCFHYKTGSKTHNLLGLILLEDQKLVQHFIHNKLDSRAILKITSVFIPDSHTIEPAIYIDNFYGSQEGFLSISKLAYQKALILNLHFCIGTEFEYQRFIPYATFTVNQFSSHQIAINIPEAQANELHIQYSNLTTPSLIIVKDPIF